MARLERPLLSGMEPDRTMTVDDFLKLYGSGTGVQSGRNCGEIIGRACTHIESLHTPAGKPVWPLSNDDNSRDSNDSTSALAADCNMLINLSTRLVAQPRPCMQGEFAGIRQQLHTYQDICEPLSGACIAEIDAEKLDGLLGSYPLTPAVTANYLGLSSRPRCGVS